MKQSHRYIDKYFPNHICKLKRSLYGLKWFKRLYDFLILIGFKASKTNASLFICYATSKHIYFLIYVDVILVIGSERDLISTVLDMLAQAFK